jgi:hypothetical protein
MCCTMLHHVSRSGFSRAPRPTAPRCRDSWFHSWPRRWALNETSGRRSAENLCRRCSLHLIDKRLTRRDNRAGHPRRDGDRELNEGGHNGYVSCYGFLDP